jgi:all-trans-retinol dehydrogenase (NAD+)
VRTRFPLLLPILREADVATRVLGAIQGGRQQLMLPPLVRVLPLLRLLPVGAFDAVLNLFGINRSMDHFVGRDR